ncbi:MAG: hypothetical protein MZU84_07895 [Sphingobacterium sp.]|nr:hypothetical protein [Sphingobacterium sp.]
MQKDPFDLTPVNKENLSLDDLKKTWMGTAHYPTVFMSAVEKINLEEFKSILYEEVKKIHIKIYPYNNFLFEK